MNLFRFRRLFGMTLRGYCKQMQKSRVWVNVWTIGSGPHYQSGLVIAHRNYLELIDALGQTAAVPYRHIVSISPCGNQREMEEAAAQIRQATAEREMFIRYMEAQYGHTRS